MSNPGSHFPLRGNGNGGWFGWPTDDRMEALRDKWFDAPDLAAQQAVCKDMQRLAFQDLPFFPTGPMVHPDRASRRPDRVREGGLHAVLGGEAGVRDRPEAQPGALSSRLAWFCLTRQDR